ncbi:zinc ribbon domain-containing protein [Bacillus aerolatus]|uniref:zinc ribbon domain-containing protein n=1 Tax=Bacillus aerolatus TaxID=2653354 RepID=UPI0017832544|nr:zinc ribbon domain-containing protein [Bacillus aerolatus]
MSDLQTKIGGGLNKLQDSLQTGKQKIQSAQEISQYKRLIQETYLERNEILLQLGEEVYKKLRSQEIHSDEWAQKAASLSALDHKIYQAQQAIAAANAQSAISRTCPNCQNPITADDKFCGSCGTKVEIPSTETDVETKTCAHCEEQIPASALFCICCGVKTV